MPPGGKQSMKNTAMKDFKEKKQQKLLLVQVNISHCVFTNWRVETTTTQSPK